MDGKTKTTEILRFMQYLHENPPAPFNPSFRPGLQSAAQAEYLAYCELPDSPQDSGSCPIRAAKYQEIIARNLPTE